MSDQTLLDVFSRAAVSYPKQFFHTKDRHKYYRSTSFAELHRRAKLVALELISLGVNMGDNVAVIADNRQEWLITDMAIQIAGGVCVPRGSDSSANEIRYILEHCGAKIVFIEHLRLYKKIAEILSELKVKVFVLDPEFPKDTLAKFQGQTLFDLITNAKPLTNETENILYQIRCKISGKDPFTIIYTSGTTGNPKGVVLTHSNMLYQLSIVPNLIQLEQTDRILSILPIWHIFERLMLYCTIHGGANLYYTSTKDLMEDFIRVKPTLMASAPRLWETIYQRLRERVDKTEALNRELFDLSYDIKKGLHEANNTIQNTFQQVMDNGIFSFLPELPEVFGDLFKSFATKAALTFPDMYLDPIFLMRVRAMLGGELRGTISGGGALPRHIDEFFNAIGIPVYEGYGMTECSPVIAMRSISNVQVGTVGKIVDGTLVEIRSEDNKVLPQGSIGVIWVKGPGVTSGYYKNASATENVLKDGWLNTGDLGRIDENGNLSIRGRAKDTIVLMGGENIEPVPIETLLTQHPLIEQAVVVGQDKKNLGVLIWPSYERLEDAGYAVDEFDPNCNLNAKQEIIHLFRGVLSEIVNEKNGFKSFEHVSHIRFLPKKLLVGQELTNLQKIKRNVVHSKYEQLIESMYQGHHHAHHK
ncbi:MAG: long-chain fatty acid--CoA ligase [Leptospiraceae bacterium]|nr:long-chain fatty acid--CoA ligase [Leptospiraceae bacterium]